MFGNVLKRLRKSRGLRQDELADALGVSQSTIASWENGTRRPDISMIPIIADYFCVTTDELLGIKPDNSDEAEILEIREMIRRDPDRKILLQLAKNGSKQTVKQIVALADALRATNPDFYDGDEPS